MRLVQPKDDKEEKIKMAELDEFGGIFKNDKLEDTTKITEQFANTLLQKQKEILQKYTDETINPKQAKLVVDFIKSKLKSNRKTSWGKNELENYLNELLIELAIK